MDEVSDDGFDGFVFEGLDAVVPPPKPLTFDELAAVLESFERHKQRLIVPSARVAEFEAAVRTAGLGHAVTVVGHPWLKEDQVFLAQSEAEFDADMQRALEAGRAEMLERMREQARADMERLREDLEEKARQDHERVMWEALHPWPRSPFAGPTGI